MASRLEQPIGAADDMSDVIGPKWQIAKTEQFLRGFKGLSDLPRKIRDARSNSRRDIEHVTRFNFARSQGAIDGHNRIRHIPNIHPIANLSSG